MAYDITVNRRLQQLLTTASQRVNVELDENKIERLIQFINELLAVNQTVNLTAIVDPEEIIDKLILDSIFPNPFIPPASRILDIGTGAGFPGIPLKIVSRDLRMTLIDGKRKKINFLKYVIRQLSIEGIEARHVRAEALAGEGRRFNVVITRAVASLADLIQLAFPLLEKEGMLIAMKGSNYQTEIEALKENSVIKTGKEIFPVDQLKINVEKYQLPLSGFERALIFIRDNS